MKFPVGASKPKFDFNSQLVSVKCHLTAPSSPNERNTWFFLYLCFVSLLGGRNGNVSYPSRTSIARHVSSFALCYISHLCIH